MTNLTRPDLSSAMTSCRPRRHSVVTLRLTVASEDLTSPQGETGSVTSPPVSHSPSPTLPPRPRSHSRGRRNHPTSPLRRTPTSPLPRSTPPPLSRTPTTPLARTPTSPIGRPPTSPLCREPTSPMGRSTPSPVSPRSIGATRHFRYDSCDRGLRRRSSLLTVPATHESHDSHLRLPRPRSSSIAGPLRPPDLARYLSEANQRRAEDGGSISGDVSICSSFDEDETSPSEHPKHHHHHHQHHPRSPSYDPFAYTHSPTRRYSSADPGMGVCRLRQFSITSRGGVVNRGDSLRPRRSASNTSVTSTVSSCSRERLPSVGSITSTPGASPSKAVTPTSTTPQHRVVMIGNSGVGKSTLITQFMTSEYMCAYDDSPGNEEGGSERSVSVLLEGEEAELIFNKLQDITQAIAREGHADGWLVVYSISDRESYKSACTSLGKVWSMGHVTQRAVILVANKTDLERTRVVSTAEGRTLAKTYECKFIEVSAGFDHNVDELLVGILTQIRLKQKANTREGIEPGTSSSVGGLSLGGSFDSSPTSATSTPTKLKHKNSFRVKGILSKLLHKDRKTKSCENLYVL